jgi:hypothetical protein
MSFCLYLTLRFLRSLAAINHSWKFAKFVIRFPTLGKAGRMPAVRFPTLGTFSSNLWNQPSATCPAEALAKEEGYGGQEICAYLPRILGVIT